jgi:ABC-type transport system substrate-binding protein
MMRHTHHYLGIKGALLATALLVVTACGTAPQEAVVETVVITATPDETAGEVEQVEVTATPDTAIEEEGTDATEEAYVASGAFSTPHPILSDVQVRRAIAHCTNRLQLLESVYPYLTEEEREEMLMDTFLPRGHWAEATEGVTTYPFDPEEGQALLEEAGWTLPENAEVRVNEDDEPLVIDFLTTNAQFRQTWAAVFEQQLLENCGIQLIRTHAPGSFVFGTTSGLQRRDFELGAFAWVGQTDPGGSTLYACDQIPLPSNNWEGQNYMGWCNEAASDAIIAATNSLDREERIEQYAIVQREFTADMVSLPLFNRLSIAAASTNVLNYAPNATEYHSWNIAEWDMADGNDTVVIGMTQEPETLFTVTNTTATAQMITFLLRHVDATGLDYDYQPVALQQLPTIENGGADLREVEVEAGDLVFTTSGDIIELAEGVEVKNSDGETITYEGGTITMPQLSVTFEYVDGITWEDGTPLSQEDLELSARISCDPEVGRASYRLCESRASIDFESDTVYTINYVPGALWSEYSVYTIAFYYPAHQELSDNSLATLAEAGVDLPAGSTLADVPASQWASLTEVNEVPLSTGPYRLVEWQKGQRMVFEANPYYYDEGPAIPNVIISFIPDSNQAVAQLLNGSIDVISNFDLEAGAETGVVLEAAEAGELQAFPITSPTWEHVDMNLFAR